MGFLQMNFKDFFQNKFFAEDKKYVTSGMPKIFEMAQPFGKKNTTASQTGSVVRKPVLIDNEDIDFLYQFPPEFWIPALHARYHDDLYSALHAREQARQPRYEELIEKVKEALTTQNFNILTDLVSPHNLRRIQKHYGSKWAADYQQNIEKAANGAAKEIAHYIVEEEISDAPVGNEPKIYTFATSGRGQKSFKARSYINRLIHKLERTRGQPHAPHTGLDKFGHTHGQYGYDLYGVKAGRPAVKSRDTDIPHSTQGLQMLTGNTASHRLRRFLATNAHGIYGDLPTAGEEVQLPSGETVKITGHLPVKGAKGRNKERVKDHFIYEKYAAPLESKYYTLLTLANGPFKLADGTVVNPQKFGTNSEKRSEAKRLANQDIEHMKKQGSIAGPPIPGHPEHWKGIPFDQEQTIHLPHFKKQVIEIDKHGNEKAETVDMPFVKPASYFRSVGSRPSDYEREVDENGNPGKIKIGPDGKPILRIPPEERTGYLKDYLPIHSDSYEGLKSANRNKGVHAAGALTLNQNSSEQLHLTYGHKDFMNRKYQVFGPEPGDTRPRPTTAMNLRKLDAAGGGLFYDDIIEGIKKCLSGTGCGEATTRERNIGYNNIEEIHQIVVQKMQQNLADPEMLIPEGRIKFAKNITSSIMQQDHEGGKSRRKRILDPSLRSTGEHEATTQDIATQKLRDKGFDNIGNVVNRRLLSGSHKFPYSVPQMRVLLDSLRQDAAESDTKSHAAKERSRKDVGDDVIELLRNSMRDKKIVASQVLEILKKMIEIDGNIKGKAKIEDAALEMLETLTKSSQSSAQLVTNFTQLPLVKKYVDPDESMAPVVGRDTDLDAAIEKLWNDYLNHIETDNNDRLLPNDQMKAALLPQNGQNVSRIAQAIATHFVGKEDIVAQGVQNAIYDALDMQHGQALAVSPKAQDRQKPTPMQSQNPAALAAKKVNTFSALDRAKATPRDWRPLMQIKDYLALAFHSVFLGLATDETLTKLRQKITTNFDQNQDEVKQALSNIDKEMMINARRK